MKRFTVDECPHCKTAVDLEGIDGPLCEACYRERIRPLTWPTWARVPHWVTLGVLLALSYLGWEFGAEIARFRAMTAALAELESCETDANCEQAWARLQAAKGGK